MKRHNRAALAVAAIALVLPVSGCASLLSPQQTAVYQYNAGDGAWGTIGDIEVRGLLMIMDDSGEGPAQLFFTLINTGSTPLDVTLDVEGESFTETVEAGGTFVQDPQSPESSTTEPIILDDLSARPGDLVDIIVSAGGEEQTIQAQLLSDSLPYYEQYVPTESPSAVPTEEATGTAGADESASTAEGSASTEGTTPTEGAEATTPAEGTTSTAGTAAANG